MCGKLKVENIESFTKKIKQKQNSYAGLWVFIPRSLNNDTTRRYCFSFNNEAISEKSKWFKMNSKCFDEIFQELKFDQWI